MMLLINTRYYSKMHWLAKGTIQNVPLVGYRLPKNLHREIRLKRTIVVQVTRKSYVEAFV